MTPTPFKILLAAGLLALPPAHAERADREKPVLLEADRIAVDDAKKLHILEGNVQLVRGTLMIRTARLVVAQDNEGFQKASASGGANGLASFRQKREGRDDYVEGEAERIEYDAKTEKTELSGRARVKSGLDEVSGQHIAYDGRNENYVVSGGTGTGPAAGKPERVRAVIQPRGSDAKPAVETAKPR